jgi:hypothetical protein
MVFTELMKSVSNMFSEWKSDKTLDEYYRDNEEALQKEFISCIQKEIGSDFIVLTEKELMDRQENFHAEMEGTA